jgi:hypothetical protein
MAGTSPPSALITEQGRRVHLRIQGRQYELGQTELRALLGLPPGSPGLGITVNNDRFHFEFSADGKAVELSARQLHRLMAKQLAS